VIKISSGYAKAQKCPAVGASPATMDPCLALGWVVKQGPAELGLRLGAALWQLWHVRDYQSEGREWLACVLAAPGALAPTVARAEALDGACELCELAVHQGEGNAAGRLAEESLAIYAALDDQRGSPGHCVISRRLPTRPETRRGPRSWARKR
jgi:hypothetical protein